MLLPEVESSPVKYSLLYHNDTEITTSIVDIETVTETDNQLHYSNDNDIQERQCTSGLVVSVANSSPKRPNSDLTPNAKRCRRSQSSCSPHEDKCEYVKCKTPPRSSPLKNFSIVLSDSLKSPMKSPTFSKTPSPVKSPVTSNNGSIPGGIQSPRRCVVLLHDITKSPMSATASPHIPTDSRNKRITRSVSVSPEQNICRDRLMDSPVKEETVYSPANVHRITDMSPKHQHRPRDILQVSSQTSPQKDYH